MKKRAERILGKTRSQWVKVLEESIDTLDTCYSGAVIGCNETWDGEYIVRIHDCGDIVDEGYACDTWGWLKARKFCGLVIDVNDHGNMSLLYHYVNGSTKYLCGIV
jgi:hypothetical protein